MAAEMQIITPPPFWTQKGFIPQGAGYSRSSNISRGVGADDDVMISKEDGFHILMDVIHYAPSEITAKVLPDNVILVQGKHEEKMAGHGHGYVERNFTRKYIIPKEFSAKDARMEIMSDGFLSIDATTKI